MNSQRTGSTNTMRSDPGSPGDAQKAQRRKLLSGESSAVTSDGDKPLRYYQDLRRDAALSYSTSPGSQIIEVQPLDEKEPIRLMHLAQIMPLTDSNFFIYLDAPGLLALKHFNERSNTVVPNLSEILDGCNLYMTMDMLDSQFSPIVASAKFYNYFTHEATLQTPQPAGVVGAALSRVSRPLTVLTGTYGIPQISPASTAAQLDSEESAPTFGRTIPTNAGEAEASAVYFDGLGVSHFAILYVRDDYGISFQKDLVQAAQRYGITVVSAAYQDGNPESIESALKVLKASNLQYMYGILQPGTFEGVLEKAYDFELVGDGYTWYLPGIDAITERNFSLDQETDAKLAKAIQGAQVLGIRSRPNLEFEESISSLQTDPDFQSFFLESHPDLSAYDGVNFTDKTPVISPFSYTAYDAVMALGIAACESEDYFFSGPDFFEQFKVTSFDGASGGVTFDLATGTRKFDTLSYSFTSVFADENLSTPGKVVFNSRLSTLVDFDSNETITTVNPTIYSDGTTNEPLALPLFEEEMNLIPMGVLAVGWILVALLCCTCMALVWWVQKYRKKQVVRASQPIFLVMLLVGTSLMASSIIPMTFQEPDTSQFGLDIACMATPWLLGCGFSIAFSAIFTKSWRLKIIVRESVGMHRAHVSPKDVLLPFTLLMITNVMLLTVWTIRAPLVWTRVPVENNFDAFGRAVESYGTCKGRVDEDNNSDLSVVFLSILGGINFCVVVAAFISAYLTRDMPSQFNESYHVSLSIAIMLESILLGVPILFLAGSNPTANFLIRTLLIVSVCIAVLGPSFLPKLYMQHRAGTAKGAMLREWGSYMSNRALTPPSNHFGFRRQSRSSNRLTDRSDSRDRSQGADASMPSSVAQLKASIARKKMASSTTQATLPSSVAELRASIAAQKHATGVGGSNDNGERIRSPAAA